MKEMFNKIPTILKKQIIIRLILGVVFEILFLLIICFTGDFLLSMPCLVIWIYLFASGFMLIYNCVTGHCISVTGQCVEIRKSTIFKRVKTIFITSEQGIIKIPNRRLLRRLSVGDSVVVYMSDKTSVYEQDNVKVICNYYAIAKVLPEQE